LGRHREKFWQAGGLAERNQAVVSDVADGQTAGAQREYIGSRAQQEPMLIFLIKVADRGEAVDELLNR